MPVTPKIGMFKRQKMAAMYKDGATAKEIAAEFGVQETTVYTHLHALGVSIRTQAQQNEMAQRKLT